MTQLQALSLLLLLAPGAFAAGPVKFNRDIRPIMSDTCFRCHGPDKKARMAGLRLDIREEAIKPTKSGVIPIVPGDAEKSAIVQRVFAATPAKIMPPVFAHKELTQGQKETIRQWVAEGASYEGHWSYQPVKRPGVPAVQDGAASVRNPIDAFIQSALASRGWKPSPEADKRTLLRRVTLDLTGLAPTPEEMESFANDSSAGAYEKVVDRLLASPRYAEMQALRWLDAVRYGDSAGFHGDNLWPAWPYRDYVLRAFRDNKPFDQFTREQLAGDLIPNATVEQKVASAFNRLTRTSAEGGLQPKEYLAKYGADRVRTVSTVWMGATLGCAECHDHKFDPFTAKDFYSMKAFFADIKETGLMPDRGVKAWGAKLPLPSDEQKQHLAELDARLAAAQRALHEKAHTLDDRRWDWEDRILADFEAGKLKWQYQRPTAAQSVNGAKLAIYNDEPIDSSFYLNGSLAFERGPGEGVVVASGANPDNETYVVQVKPGAGTWTALGIDVHQDETLPGSRLARGADRFVLTEVEAELSGDKPRKLPFTLATSTGAGELPETAAMNAIDGDPKSGWAVAFGEARNPFIALRFSEKLTTGPDSVLTVRLKHDSGYRRAVIGRFRIALSAGEYSWPESGESASKRRAKPAGSSANTLNIAVDHGLLPEVLAALKTLEEERTEEQQKLVLEHFEWSYPELEPLIVKAARLEAERGRVDAEIPRVIYTERIRPRVTRLLPRGNFLDESGEVVKPAIPAFLGAIPTAGGAATRLDLANWIVSKDNPLTARVFVNRQWRQLFGTGLSKVLEDLGSQGELPVHLELMDWLAAELMERWDMKHLVRTLVTSHTYRQSSLSTPELDERDPDNRWLARQSRLRVDAEIVHDVALSISGLLVEKFGGPSVKPYEPEAYLAAMNFPKREYSASRGEDLYRRGIYTQWQRTFLHPTFAAFDAPTREECAVNRTNSNTPLQALVLLNDPIFVEAARVFAANILKQGGATPEKQIDWAFARALNRTPAKEERKILMALYTKSLGEFQHKPADAAGIVSVGEFPLPEGVNKTKLAAMTTIARAILNLHEAITRN